MRVQIIYILKGCFGFVYTGGWPPFFLKEVRDTIFVAPVGHTVSLVITLPFGIWLIGQFADPWPTARYRVYLQIRHNLDNLSKGKKMCMNIPS